jgi:amidase
LLEHPLLEQHRGRIKPTVIEEIERGARLTGPRIAAAETLRTRLFTRTAEFLRDYDFLVLPTVQVPPFDIEQEYVTEIAGVPMPSYVDWMRSCYFISMTALPAISVPAGFTPEGLPVGLQIVGRHQDDWGVLQIAHAFGQVSGIKPAVFPS